MRDLVIQKNIVSLFAKCYVERFINNAHYLYNAAAVLYYPSRQHAAVEFPPAVPAGHAGDMLCRLCLHI